MTEFCLNTFFLIVKVAWGSGKEDDYKNYIKKEMAQEDLSDESSVVVIGGTPEISQPLAIMYEGEKAKVVPTNAMANDRLMRRAGLTACVCGMGRSPCGTATGRKTNAQSMCNQVREALRLLHFLLLILSPQSRDHDRGKEVPLQRLFKDPLWTFFLCSYVI